MEMEVSLCLIDEVVYYRSVLFRYAGSMVDRLRRLFELVSDLLDVGIL